MNDAPRSSTPPRQPPSVAVRHARTSDGRLDVALDVPQDGRLERAGNKSEQLFMSAGLPTSGGAASVGRAAHLATRGSPHVGIGTLKSGGLGLAAALDLEAPHRARAERRADEASTPGLPLPRRPPATSRSRSPSAAWPRTRAAQPRELPSVSVRRETVAVLVAAIVAGAIMSGRPGAFSDDSRPVATRTLASAPPTQPATPCRGRPGVYQRASPVSSSSPTNGQAVRRRPFARRETDGGSARLGLRDRPARRHHHEQPRRRGSPRSRQLHGRRLVPAEVVGTDPSSDLA